MANIRQIQVNNSTYDIKDATARTLIGTESGAAIGTAINTTTSADDVVEALAELSSRIAGMSDNDTKNTAGIVSSDTKMYIVGSTTSPSSTAGAYAVTNTNAKAYVTAGKVYSNNSETVNLADNQTIGGTKTFNGTVIVPTPTSNTHAATKQYVDETFLGASHFIGVANAYTDITVPYNAGDYWVVGTAGTYAGQTCEAGDFIYATTSKTSSGTKANSDFKVVQANIDLSDFKIRDWAYTTLSCTSSNADGSFMSNGQNAALSSNIYSTLKSNYDAYKITVVSVTLSAYSGETVDIVMFPTDASGSTFKGYGHFVGSNDVSSGIVILNLAASSTNTLLLVRQESIRMHYENANGTDEKLQITVHNFTESLPS